MGDGAKLATAYLELIPSMQGAQKSIASQLAPAAGGAGKSAGSSLGGALLGGLKRFAGPIALVAAGFSVKKIISSSVKEFEGLAASVNGLQRVAGGTKEQVSGLRGALQLSGVDSTKATGSLTIFAKTLNKAKGDTKATADLTKKLGTNFLDAAGNIKPMSEILPGVSDKFKEMPNGAEKTALAVQLFGRSGTAMLPFLNKGSAGLSELTAQAKKMGLVIDDTSANTFANAKVSARNYASSIQGLQVTLGGALLPALTAVKNVFRNAMTPVIIAVTGLIAKNRDAFVSAGAKIDAFATGVGKAMTEFIGGITGGTDAVGSSQTKFAQWGAVIYSIFAKVGAVVNVAKSLIGSALSTIGSAFSYIAGFVSGNGSKVDVGWLEGPLQTVGTVVIAVQHGLEVVGKAIGNAFSMIGPLLAPLGPVFSQMASAIGPVIKQFLGLYLQISPVSILIKAIAPILPQLGQALSSVFTALMPVVTQVFGMIGTVLMQIAPMLIPLAAQLAGVFTSILTAVLPLIPVLLQLVTAVLPLVVQLIQTLVPIMLPLVSTILGLVIPVIQALLPVVTTVFQAIVPIIQAAIQIVQGILQVVTGIISGNWSQVWTGIKNIFGGIWNVIKAIVIGALNIVTSVIGAALNIVKAVWSGAWNALKGILSAAFGGLIDNARGQIRLFVAVFDTIKDSITNAFSWAGTILSDVGKKIIDGLISGIKGALGGLKDMLGTVTDLIPDWKGPAARDKVLLYNNGQLIMGGLIRGISSEKPGLKSMLGGITDSMSALVNVPVPKALTNFAIPAALTRMPTMGLTAAAQQPDSSLPKQMQLVDTRGDLLALVDVKLQQTAATRGLRASTGTQKGR